MEKRRIPFVSNDRLQRIYNDPMGGLDIALNNFIDRATTVYDSEMKKLHTGSVAYIFLTTYGPHVLESLFDAAVDEYESISKAAILKIQRLELTIWIATILTLFLELGFIFIPVDRHIRKTLNSLEKSITDLTTTRERLLAAQQLARVGDWQLNVHNNQLTWSDEIYEICGVSKDRFKVSQKSSLELIHPEDQSLVKTALQKVIKNKKTIEMENRMVRPDGDEKFVFQRVALVLDRNGQVEFVSGTIQDITERKESENQIQELALYDPLTSLANRRLLKDRLLHAIATSHRKHNYGAVLMLDMDNFKALNDTKGHDVGDALLVEIAQRLKSCVRDTDTIARLGGDEFVVILEWLGEDEEMGCKRAMDLAEKIRATLGNPYLLGEKDSHVHHASVSIGVAVFQGAQKNENELLKRADIAMYEAKDLGRNRTCFFNEKRQAIINTRSAMAHDLQRAILNKELSLYLQPQISSTGRICGAESLLRWFPPGKDPIPPDVFIPIAEENGLILPIGEWVLEKACEHLLDLSRHDLPPEFKLAVNISARQFTDDGFLTKVKKIIDQKKVDVRRLKFELTESSLIQNLDRGKDILSELRGMGLRIELDDFGTGYSSLSVLGKLPLDTIKLDRSFINGINDEGNGKAIIRAAIAMAKAMSLDVIAEGVETHQQSNFLIKEGCDMLQGFLYARPMPYVDFKAFIQTFPNTTTKSIVFDSIERL